MSEAMQKVSTFLSSQTVQGTALSMGIAYALSIGMDLDRIQELTGVSGTDLMDPEVRPLDKNLANLWVAIAKQNPDKSFSLEMAKAAPLSILGGLAHGAQFASSLRQIIDFFIQNGSILGDRLRLTLMETKTEAALTLSHPLDNYDEGRVAEVILGIFWRVFTEVLDTKVELNRVEFIGTRQGPLQIYRHFFQSDVLFQQPQNALVFPRDSLSTPLNHANLQLFSFAKQHFDQVRERLEAEHYPSELQNLRQAIFECAEQGYFDTQTVVAQANLSRRSAYRLTSVYGTTVKQLIDDVRAKNTKALLSDPKISIAQAGTLAGFSDDRAFRRAFKRWTGQTPTEFQKSVIADKL